MLGESVRIAAFITALCLSASTAYGQIGGDEATALADAERSNLPPDSIGGDLSLGKVGEDWFLTLGLGITIERDLWGFGARVPLRFRIFDRDPDNPSDPGGLRREDWDQPSDFLRVLRFVYVGQRDKKGPYYVRAGQLSSLGIGYGTIMHRYHNGLDAARFHAGINAAVNIDAYGGEAMIGDLLSPYLFGGRFTVRPLQVAWGEGYWDRLVTGFSLLTDVTAPLQLTSSMDRVVTNEGIPSVERDRALVISGLDVGFEVVTLPFLTITPYTALNKMSVVDHGLGWHAGVLWRVTVPLVLDTFEADLRTEYQRVSGDYRGPYFNTVYEIERYQVLASNGGSRRTKLGVLCGNLADCSQGNPGAKNGVFLDLRAGLPNWIYVGGEYLNYDGGRDEGTLRLSLEVPALEFVEFSAFYFRINITGTDDLFAIDDRSAIVAQATVPIAWVLSAQARWWRVWQATDDGYMSVDDWSVGVGVNLTL
jgi:hypothetical protein